MLFLYLFVPDPTPSDEVFQRYEAFMRQAPNYEAKVTVTFPDGPPAAVKLIFGRDKGYRFEGTLGNESYVSGLVDNVFREYEKNTQVYSELPRVSRIAIVESRVASVSERAFPVFLFNYRFRRGLPPDAKFALTRDVRVGDRTGDKVRVEFQTQMMGVVVATATIGAKGEPLAFEQWYVVPGDREVDRRKWTIDSFQRLPEAPVNRFRITFPDGFVPYALPRIYGPLSVGSMFPNEGWSGPEQSLRLMREPRNKMIAVLGSDCEPSKLATASLAKIQSAGLPVLTITNSRTPSGDRLYSRDGKAYETLVMPSTPMFFLVDTKGSIARIWMGYATDIAKRFEREVAYAAKELGKAK